ncbi:2-oxo-4-hydroxy-4-carboxy-5-ureidoimidazoline decarboxylase [Pseudonocardia phyllosphaerae]|uniref:2-oxo-4-hydroxy-4-carboxy-5-ureidoimidazoline decarboxylase n=1 Tax=Pseudonocardia phyllosphaerae TaxID=3390502 RepID=UPI0039780054
MHDAVPLDRFNAATAAELDELLRACVSSPAWAERILAGRPYGSIDDLVAAGEKAVRDLDTGEVDAALAGHPRIGERTERSSFSADEQAGVRRSSGQACVDGGSSGQGSPGSDSPGPGDDTAARLADGNARYEDRFGYVFLIRAAGRDAEEILAELERRLGNDPAAERAEAAGQLAEITALRLRRVVTP